MYFTRLLSRPICTHHITKIHHRSISTTSNEALIYPEIQNSNHHDLYTFLDHASRTGLDPQSTTYVGTHYEYTVQSALRRLRMSLQRIGGAGDEGIDLLGTWSLPSRQESLKVIIQCKAHERKVGPSVARELEGAFVGAPIGWRGSGVLGLLVAQQPATKGVREALGRSRWPLGFILCSRDGGISQMMWNKKAQEEGLEGIDVGLRYRGEGKDEKEVVLTWNGKVIRSLKTD